MRIKEITDSLEQLASPALQEAYDNAGLLTGNPQQECSGVLITLDVTEEIIAEAIERKCNLIVAHHPIIFKGLKRITGSNVVERVVIASIKNDIALYAIHTNLDNVFAGVNRALSDQLGLKDCSILLPASGKLKKLVTFVPVQHAAALRDALFLAGAGNVGQYSECSFNIVGTGTFKAGDNSRPFVGEKGKQHHESEERIEVIYPADKEREILDQLKKNHPYEEVAYYVQTLDNLHQYIGSGMMGELTNETDEQEFLSFVKKQTGIPVIRHTRFTGKKIKKVAICGGAGIFLMPVAKARGADVFLTSDIKYHDFFDADGKLLMADIGHYESEQFATGLLKNYLKEKFPNFAVQKSEGTTNPVHYLI